MNDFHFQVDLKGLIRLLSDNLYAEDSVFLRELLQNAVDAITARKQLDASFTDGSIHVHYRQLGADNEICFTDNGIGLTEAELHEFLSVIGQSSKRSDQTSFIGQFGIGLLSCFLVANEIEVVTRSVHEEQTNRWIGHSDGVYEISHAETDMPQAGTQVRLRLTGRAAQKFDRTEIKSALEKFGFLIEQPIYFATRSGEQQLNDVYIPWRQEICTAGDILEFGERVFDEHFFDAVPITGEGMHGYAYLCEHTENHATHKIFLQHMLLTEDGKDLIPKWATFIRCIIDTDCLTPTASREGFQRNAKLSRARAQIERCLLNYFIDLSKFDIVRMKQLAAIHNIALKSFALENDRVFKQLFPFLLFTSNKENLTGAQILVATKKMPVYYCTDIDTFHRVKPLLQGTRRLVLNAGYIYDTPLFQNLAKNFPGVKISLFEDRLLEEIFEEPSQALQQDLAFFMTEGTQALQQFNCRVVLKRFSPEEQSAVFIAGSDSFLVQELSALDNDFDLDAPSFFDDFSDAPLNEQDTSALYLNADNDLIQSLVNVTDAPALRAAAQVLYTQALLSGHHTVGARELQALSSGLKDLLRFGVGQNMQEEDT